LLFLLRLSVRALLFPYTTLFRSQIELPERISDCEQVAVELRFARARAVCVCRRRAVREVVARDGARDGGSRCAFEVSGIAVGVRSEEHTSELQSREKLVCRLLLE